jgi:acyl carrier protein
MNKDEIKLRIRDILANALKVDSGAITDDTSQIGLSEWDSVKHMNVVLATENEFGIEFKDSELPMLTSVPLLAAAVEKHLAT